MLKTKRRLALILFMTTLMFLGLLFRLSWIQLIQTDSFSSRKVDLTKRAVEQRKETFVLDPGRGDIFDRKRRPLTGTEETGLLVFPLVREQKELDPKIRRLAEILNWPPRRLTAALEEMEQPGLLQTAEGGAMVTLSESQALLINELQIPGLAALPVTKRYRETGLARHLIGFTGQNPTFVREHFARQLQEGTLELNSRVGVAGLERSFEPFLGAGKPTTVSYHTDGLGRPLNGLAMRFVQSDSPFYPLSLVTTIDRTLQARVEEILDAERVKKGAAVVLDTRSANVLAMASRPNFDPYDVDFQSASWRNRAVRQLAPGSVFKTVVAAAALETGTVTPDREFLCEGEYGKYGFSCWRKGGHGRITFAEAYAQSCNITFAKVARELGAETIERYARKLGVTQANGWQADRLFKIDHFKQFALEDAGRVFADTTPKHDEGVLIQTAIGQRDVRMTPLQAANMMVTVLNGGTRRTVRAVDQLEYKDGSTFYTFGAQEETQDTVKRYTAYQLRKLMERVVREGTGTALKDARWELAGKSGTAQTASENGRYHQWFVGYGPADYPRYAVAVVVEDRPASADNRSVTVFQRIMDELAQLENVSEAE